MTGPSFAHASEEELSRILEYYQVEWAYEPRTFPILWNLEGKVVESFTPDFYLPELDLFVELTTLKQSLVRKKNRKLRRLRELYPDVRIKLFYAKDFKALMLKYGRVDLVASLTGPEGQARPPRPESEEIDLIDRPVEPAEGEPAIASPGIAAAPRPVQPAASGPAARRARRRARRRAARALERA